MMHLTPYANHGVTQLSGGQRQHMAPAHALAPEPRTLLLDEPLMVLDTKLRKSVHVGMDRPLRGLGIMTIYMTHDQEEATALTDRIVVTEAGCIAQTGTPRKIYFQPADRHVVDFIGIVSRPDDTCEDGAFVCVDGRVPMPAGDGDTIFLRSEDAVLVDPTQTVLKGTVEPTLFLDFRTRVRVAGVSATSLFIDVSDHQRLALGHAVDFNIPADRLLTLQA